MLYTVYDLETTGFSPVYNNPISMAFITLNSDNECVDSGELYFCDDSIEESTSGALSVHHLSKEVLEPYRVNFRPYLRKAYKLYCRGNLVGWNNQRFDDNMLSMFLQKQGLKPTPKDKDRCVPNKSIDLMKTYRPVFGVNLKLGVAAEKCSLDANVINIMYESFFHKKVGAQTYHTAAYDATVTALLFINARRKNLVKM